MKKRQIYVAGSFGGLSIATGIEEHEIESMVEALKSFGNKSEMDIKKALAVFGDTATPYSKNSTRRQKRLSRIKYEHPFKKFIE